MLLEELTDPTMRNNKFETPLDLAALYGRLEVVKMLLNAHPNLLSCNTKKHTPLHLAARNGHKAVVHVLLDAGMDSNYQVSGVSEWGWAGHWGLESSTKPPRRGSARRSGGELCVLLGCLCSSGLLGEAARRDSGAVHASRLRRGRAKPHTQSEGEKHPVAEAVLPCSAVSS